MSQSNAQSEKVEEFFPKTLYKFRCFDKEGLHQRILTDNKIFFASPIQFNDPFDCRIPHRYDDGNNMQILNMLQRAIQRTNPSVTDIEAYMEAKKLFSIDTLINPEMKRQLTIDFNAKLGIFSLSKNYTNLLQWAHYADSHRGFCIGFNTPTLLGLTAYYHDNIEIFLVLDKVNYVVKYPYINPYSMKPDERMRLSIFTKSSDWEYEQEYRMVLEDGARNEIPIPDNAICRVIMGCQISDVNQRRLIDIMKKRNKRIPLWKAKTSDHEFKLEFERVRY